MINHMKFSGISAVLAILVIFALCAGCTLPGSQGDLVIREDPVPVVPDVDPVEEETEPTPTPDAVTEITPPDPGPVPTQAIIPEDVLTNETKYYLLMNDTATYTYKTRIFDVNVTGVPFIFYFSFDPGYITKYYLVTDGRSTGSYYQGDLDGDGNPDEYQDHSQNTALHTTTRLNPNSEFTIQIVRIYDDPAEYQAAVAAAGGKERLSREKLLYEDNGIIVRQDGFGHGHSSEVEKELKVYQPGHYRLVVYGNSITTQIMLLSPE
jgi:hypothetical protein